MTFDERAARIEALRLGSNDDHDLINYFIAGAKWQWEQDREQIAKHSTRAEMNGLLAAKRQTDLDVAIQALMEISGKIGIKKEDLRFSAYGSFAASGQYIAKEALAKIKGEK